MTKTVLLNNIDHGKLRVITKRSAAYGDSINQVLIFPTEYAEVQREYPIFFRKGADGAFQSVALLGLDREENLYLNEKGWNARYLPAVQERGPFLIGRQKETSPEAEPDSKILVDLDDPRVNEKEGEAVFLPQGGNSPYLRRIVRVLNVIEQGVEVSAPMFEILQEMNLIEPLAVEINVTETQRYTLPNLYTVGDSMLARLDGASLEKLNKTGVLRAAHHVLASLGNVSRLIELKQRKLAGGTA